MTFRRSVLAAITVLNCQSGLTAAESCPAWHAGRFENPEHGYSFVVPSAVMGSWQSPCISDSGGQCTCLGVHGLYMPLSQAASLSVFSGYAAWVEANASERAVVASVIKLRTKDPKHQASMVTAPHKIVINGRRGYRYEETFRDADSKTEMRTINYVFVGAGPVPIEVEFSLTAPKAQFGKYLPRLYEVLKSVVWLHNNHGAVRDTHIGARPERASPLCARVALDAPACGRASSASDGNKEARSH